MLWWLKRQEPTCRRGDLSRLGGGDTQVECIHRAGRKGSESEGISEIEIEEIEIIEVGE